MKELSVEEKARAYDKAIEKINSKWHYKDKPCFINVVEIFPELKESEDERIRKELINYFINGKEYLSLCSFSKEEILAWLEKQGEQKPTIEMKSAEESLGIDSDTYNEIVDECIYGEQKPAELPKGEDYGIDGLYHAIRILEEALGKVDGYQTDDGILEHKCAISAVKNLYEQKPAWSEEDERLRNSCISHIEEELEQIRNDKYGHSEIISDLKESCRERIKWLKSLKPQNKWKPSDEQIYTLEEAMYQVGILTPLGSKLNEIYEQLNNLRGE